MIIDVTPAHDDTPEDLHRKLALANTLLDRQAIELEATRNGGLYATRQLIYLVQLRRLGYDAMALGHIDLVDMDLFPSPKAVH